jgi:hypothetical protein
MSANRRISQARKRPTHASHPHTEPGGRYIAPAPVSDVMFEQLQYLAAHSSVQGCPCGCEDCARLTQVAQLLLLPFLCDMRQGMPSQADSVKANG